MHAALVEHLAREISKGAPSIGVVIMSSFIGMPWRQLGYMLGCVLILLQIAYGVWKWRREARAKTDKITPTVPPDA